MRRFVFCLILVFVSGFSFGQKPFNLLDTIQLEEIVSYGNLRKYQSGAKLETLSSVQLTYIQEGGLNQLISRLTPIYIKSDAGGLSTIHFRGTSASHTSINFGGINVNSLTLGQSNLSNIPSFLFDEIKLQYGSSSTVNGSGAVGGALYLGLSNEWTDGLKVNIKATEGSFGEFLNGAKIFGGNGKWESVTRIYRYQKENNFPFLNPYIGNIENPDPVQDIQHGAALKNYGVLQEFNYKFTDKNYLKSSVWWQINWYQIQPNMATNLIFNESGEMNDNSLKVWTEYLNKERIINYKLGAGYVYDLQEYNEQETQRIGTDRFISELELTTDLNNGIGLKAGAKYLYIDPDVYAYSDSVIDFEQRIDFYFSTYYQVFQNLRLTLNLRQGFITGFSVPFTPSIGGEYIFKSGMSSIMKFTSAISKSYRVPTFNDRFWGTQGNPILKPEDGNNLEAGIQYIQNKNNSNVEFGINAFYMDLKNWIEWRNLGVEWKAKNVMEVVSKGVEFQLKSGFKLSELNYEMGLNYTLNPVEAIKTEDENGITGRQLNYVPLHMGNGWLSIYSKNWRFFADAQLTGKRFTDDFGHTLPSNLITNAGISYLIEIQNHSLDLSLSSNNIFDIDYQNEKYYAMPGRFFRVSLAYEFKTTNN